ncbi:Ig-like domain-containing protein [uncultured Methanobrevibacter sp.]|uniref:Ig-like domain-containing protein n=1 Tax=uncultured Methanobrevibacter sp. TaxID=253161 RepID=UPI00261AEDD9|nr:Ig-like domain repeat protein [uncultured Methanobrevibacter sp.]
MEEKVLKLKKIMTIFAIILVAFMVIGAVTASEDVSNDELAANDIAEDSIGETPVDDVIAETPEQTTGANAEDFNAWIANETFDVDNDKDKVVINFTSPADAKGDVQVWANEKYKAEIHIDESTAGKNFNWTLSDLYISEAGVYEISLRCNSEGGGQLVIATGTFTVAKNYSKADFTTMTFDYIGTTGTRLYSFAPAPVYGTLRVYVDGKESYNKYINNKYTYLQLYVEDLNISENGEYNIRTEYIVEDSGQVVALDDFNSSVQCFPVSLFISEMDIDVAAGYASLGSVYDDYGVVGTITAYIDDNLVFNNTYSDYQPSVQIKQYTLPTSFVLGNHTVKISYTKNGKEYTKEGNVFFYAEPQAISPGWTMTAGDDKNITVKYYKGTTGTITVYNAELVSPGVWKKISIFMSTANLNGSGIYYVPLNTLDAGHHWLGLNITLGTYSFETYLDFNVIEPVDPRPEVVINVDNPSIVDYGPASITVTTEGVLNISAKISGKSLEVSGNTIYINGFNASSDPYYLVITAVPDADHKAGSPKAVPLYVNPLNTSITVPDIDDASVGQEVTLVAKVNSTITVNDGKVAFTDDNGDDIGEAPVVNGTATIKYTPTATGTLNINADYTGINFKGAFGVGHITVSKAKGIVQINASDVITDYNGGKFLVATLKDVNGNPIAGANVSVKIDKETNYTTDSAGQIKASCDGIDPGDYVADIIFKGDDNYLEAKKSVNVTVNKLDTSIDVEVASIAAGQVAYINVTLDSKASGSVVLKFKKQNYTETIENGKASFAISDLTVGNYTFEAVYAGDKYYNNASAEKSIKVTKANITSVDFPKVISEKDSKFSFDMPADATGNVTLSINNVIYPAKVENGKVNINLEKLEKGNYDYNVSYSGDDKYNPFNATGVISVNNIATIISISEVNGDRIITGVLKDVEGKPIADVTIKAIIGTATNQTKTDDKGVFTFKIPENTEVTLAFDGKDAFLASNTTITLKNFSPVRTATKIIGENYTQYAVDYFAGERGGYFKVKLTDASGAPLANKTVNIGYNGKCLVLVSDKDGFVKVQINLVAANTLTFAVAFLGDDNYNASFEVYKITINKKTTSLSAPAKTYKASAKTKSYTVTLKTIKGSSADGKTYLGSGKTITLSVNGQTYTAKTNAKGQATFNLKITKKGTYTATVKYAGDNTYNAAKATAKIKIN